MQVTIERAVEAHKAGNLQEAEALYRAILQDNPKHPDANHNLGVIAVFVNKPVDALPLFRTALEINPKQGQYWLSYIDALIKSQQFDTAKAILDQGIRMGLAGNQVDALGLTLQSKSNDSDSPLNPQKNSFTEQQRQTSTEKKDKRSSIVKGGFHRAGSPPQNEINTLLAKYQSGQNDIAEKLAMEMINKYPRHQFGWKVLGAVLNALGRPGDSLVANQKSVTLSPTDAQAHNNLGITLKELGRLDDSAMSCRKAIALKPDMAEAHYNLGNALKELGKLKEAEISFRKAITLKPDFAQAHNNLGNTLQDLDKLQEARASYIQVTLLSPDYAEAYYNLGGVLKDLGKLEEAEASCNKAIALKPNMAQAHNNLGNTLHALGRLGEAEASYKKAISLKPDYAEALSNLSNTLKDLGKLLESEACCKQAIALKPDYAAAHNNLGNVLQDLGKLEEAELSYRKAIALKPDLAEAYNNLGNTLNDLGNLEDAQACYRQALKIKPNFVSAFDNLLFNFNYDPDKSSQEIFEVYREYDDKFGSSQLRSYQKHLNDRNIKRRLKIGYVSPDFRKHPVMNFLEPLLAHHDKSLIEIYAYAELKNADSVTDRYKTYVDHWISTIGLSDDALVNQIRADEIDILVDLAGHTAGNRLGVFAKKPAPVSLSWLGYGYTSGLTAIDYFLTDEICCPSGCENFFSETPWRIQAPSLAYRPIQEGIGCVNTLPAIDRGYVTFGILSRAIRINHRTLRVWTELLKKIPNSQLVINSKDFRHISTQERLIKKFTELGIDRERLQIGFTSPAWNTLRNIDIGLDCFPHNSGTTLVESLYMGVPFVTLQGRPSMGCLGSMILHGVGHPEWVTSTEEEYIKTVVSLATDIPKLINLRNELRTEMENSSIMDESAFAKKVEAAYCKMFKKWAEG